MKKFFPNIVMSLRGPKLRAHNRPPTTLMAAERRVADLRLIFFSSQKKDIEISLIDTVEVSEARKRRRKKRVDHTIPPGRRLNISGSTSKTSVGPAWGETPKEKTAGKIIMPASKATTESSTEVMTAVRPRRVSLEK